MDYITIYFGAAVVLLIVVPIVLGILVPVVKKHSKVSVAVVNHDSAMREYVYKVYMSPEKVIDTLKQKNDADELWCEFDLTQSIVTLAKYGDRKEYFFEIQKFEDYSILKLKLVRGLSNILSYELNPFIVKKLDAELVPFEQYRT